MILPVDSHQTSSPRLKNQSGGPCQQTPQPELDAFYTSKPKLRPLAARAAAFESQDAHQAGTLGFVPRILVLTTLPHSRPNTHRFERLNGRYSLRLEARRSVGLPYGIYPRLILTHLTTKAVSTKSSEIDLGRTPHEFARKLGLTPTSGPRGTTSRLQDQLQRLFSTRVSWRYSKDFRTHESGRGLITASDLTLQRLTAGLLQRRPKWRPKVALSREIFQEITRSAVPVDLRAVHVLKGSPFAIDIYVWLTYRMSYLRRPCLIPWKGLENQFGADYARSRDFRRRFLAHLGEVLHVYPAARVSQTDAGLHLYASSPHIQAKSLR